MPRCPDWATLDSPRQAVHDGVDMPPRLTAKQLWITGLILMGSGVAILVLFDLVIGALQPIDDVSMVDVAYSTLTILQAVLMPLGAALAAGGLVVRALEPKTRVPSESVIFRNGESS